MQLCARRSSGVEITGCLATYSGDYHSIFVEDSYGNHVLLDALADADAGIDSFVDDVSLGIIRDDLKRNVGVFAQERRHKGRDDRYGSGAYNAQPQSSARAVAKAVHRIKREIDGAHDGLHVVKKLLACSGQGHASGCSVEQANAQVLLERAYRLGQSGRRDSQLRCGPGEMAVRRE